mmetsp:Transcript_17913/g.32839  ORF Transcript_17913/g.32839 Transcript_17913/m.32839 type:complete len:461 (+) Transcript_17913:178-1560(+)
MASRGVFEVPRFVAHQAVLFFVVLGFRRHFFLHLCFQPLGVAPNPGQHVAHGHVRVGGHHPEHPQGFRSSKHAVLFGFRVLAVHLSVRLRHGTRHHHGNVERFNHFGGDLVGRVEDDVVHVLAREHREDSFVQVQDWVAPAAVVVADAVVEHAHQQKVAHLLRLLQHACVARVKHVEPSVNVHHFGFAVDRPRARLAEQPQHAARGEEPRSAVRAKLGAQLALRRRHPLPVLPLLARLPRVDARVAHVVVRAHEQHPPHNLRRGHPFRARDAAVHAPSLHVAVHVLPVGADARVVTVHHEVDLVGVNHPVQVLGGHHVGGSWNNLIHPLARRHHLHPLRVRHDGGSPFALLDGLAAIDPGHEVRAQAPRLPERVGMAVVHHVERALHEDAHLFVLPARGPGLDEALEVFLVNELLQHPHLLRHRLELSPQFFAVSAVPLPRHGIVARQRCRNGDADHGSG